MRENSIHDKVVFFIIILSNLFSILSYEKHVSNDYIALTIAAVVYIDAFLIFSLFIDAFLFLLKKYSLTRS